MWVNGGVPCGEYSDLTLGRESFIHCMHDGEFAIADDVYKDQQYFIYPSAYPQVSAWQKNIMSRHETMNKRMKDWACLKKVFRHRVELHPLCFYAVANISPK